MERNAARLKYLDSLNEALIGDHQDVYDRLMSGQLTPLDAASIAGRGYDSVVGAPTRAAISAGAGGENPLTAAIAQFGANPDNAPDFGIVGNAVADPLLLAGLAGKGGKLAMQASRLGEWGGGVGSMHAPSTGAEFKAALDAAIAERPMIKDFISDYSADDLDKFRTFLSPDAQSGYAVKPDGDLINVFSNPTGRGRTIMRDAAQSGTTKLDAFDVKGKLPKLYKEFGFNELRREPNWTPGGPDVVYMNRGLTDLPQDLDNRVLRNALRLKALSEAHDLGE